MKSELGNQLRWNLALRNKTLGGGSLEYGWEWKAYRNDWLFREGLQRPRLLDKKVVGVCFTLCDFAVLLSTADLVLLIFKLHNKSIEGYADAHRYGCVVFT